MNAYPDRVRAFFIYGKMSKKHHTIPFTYTTFYDIITGIRMEIKQFDLNRVSFSLLFAI